jgi:hypothetical protein
MSSQGAVHVSPILGNTGSGQRGSGHLAVPSAAWSPDSEPVFKPYARGGTRLQVNQRKRGVLRTSASTTLCMGRPAEEKPGFQAGLGRSDRPGL